MAKQHIIVREYRGGQKLVIVDGKRLKQVYGVEVDPLQPIEPMTLKITLRPENFQYERIDSDFPDEADGQ
jgi:hypothetical protein